MRSEAELERELDKLYGLPLDEFTSARDELAKQARQEGERAVAARIKELRKPSVSAWAVNQLARSHELDVQRLLKAGKSLAAAQQAAVDEHDDAAFRQARREEHDALARLAKAAREVLGAKGHGTAALNRITQTLRAAATSEEGRELLRSGRLTEDLQPRGFEALAGLTTRPRPRASRAAGGAAAAKQARAAEAEARRRLDEAKKGHASLARRADAAEEKALQAEREASDLRAAAQAARVEADAAARAVETAEAALAEL